MEHTILSNLIYNDEYARKTLPFLKDEYFDTDADKQTFNLISDYIQKYNSTPTKEALYINLENLDGLNENTFTQIRDQINSFEEDKKTNLKWLLEKTEEFCQDKAIYNAIHSSIRLLDDAKQGKGTIPQLLSDALAVSFDTNVGHDFLDDAIDRFESFDTNEKLIPFNIDILNKITGGGSAPKTLSCIMAGTGVGKSLIMCSMAAHNLMCGYNVLYVTLELADRKVARRIESNLLDVPISNFKHLSKKEYKKRIENIQNSVKGKLIIKEYPGGSANVTHLKHLLHELKIKKNFIPDIIYIDYINLMASSRLKHGSNVNSYNYVKAVAEEVRGLAQEHGFPIWTATQSNRAAVGSSDVGLDNTSESMGLPMTLDLFIGAIATDELEEMNVILMKQLKNRDGDASVYKKFLVGIDRSKMRIYDAEERLQEDLYEANHPKDEPIMDNTKFGEEDEERGKKVSKFDRNKYRGFQ